jgi:hypothetical protein
MLRPSAIAQSMPRFPALFDALDAAREQLKYDSYGISLTTLEVALQPLLKLAESAAHTFGLSLVRTSFRTLCMSA